MVNKDRLNPNHWEYRWKDDEQFTVYCVFKKTWGGNMLDRVYIFQKDAENRVKQNVEKGWETWMVEARGDVNEHNE